MRALPFTLQPAADVICDGRSTDALYDTAMAGVSLAHMGLMANDSAPFEILNAPRDRKNLTTPLAQEAARTVFAQMSAILGVPTIRAPYVLATPDAARVIAHDPDEASRFWLTQAMGRLTQSADSAGYFAAGPVKLIGVHNIGHTLDISPDLAHEFTHLVQDHYGRFGLPDVLKEGQAHLAEIIYVLRHVTCDDTKQQHGNDMAERILSVAVSSEQQQDEWNDLRFAEDAEEQVERFQKLDVHPYDFGLAYFLAISRLTQQCWHNRFLTAGVLPFFPSLS